MAKEVRWTAESVDSFNKIINYLLEEWGEREIE